ncbi:hypothetical protein MRX96_021814 [Rhipicephalus microplus]
MVTMMGNAGANLKDAIMDDSVLYGVNFRHATLTRASLQNCDLRHAVLSNADVSVSSFEATSEVPGRDLFLRA